MFQLQHLFLLQHISQNFVAVTTLTKKMFQLQQKVLQLKQFYANEGQCRLHQ